MKRLLKFLMLVIPIATLSILKVSAASIDNGTNKNGKMVVSKILSTRCGLSSDNPVVQIDCLKRLASDYIHKESPINNMTSDEEFNEILSEYMSVYLAVASAQLNKSSTHEDDADKLAGKDTSISSPDNDARADIEANNKLANDNSALLIEALDARSMEININNVERMIGNVKIIAEDIEKDSDEDKSLRNIPINAELATPSDGGKNGQ